MKQQLLQKFVSNANLARMFDEYGLNYRFPGMPPLPTSASVKDKGDFVETAIAAYHLTLDKNSTRLHAELLDPLFAKQIHKEYVAWYAASRR